MNKKYIEILQHLLVTEQHRLSDGCFEDNEEFYIADVNYSINDLDKIYFELEKLDVVK